MYIKTNDEDQSKVVDFLVQNNIPFAAFGSGYEASAYDEIDYALGDCDGDGIISSWVTKFPIDKQEKATAIAIEELKNLQIRSYILSDYSDAFDSLYVALEEHILAHITSKINAKTIANS